MSAAEDMEFGVLGQWEPKDYTLLPPAKKQSLEASFSKTFNPLIPALASSEAGLVLSEKFSSIEAICKRPAGVATLVATGEWVDIETWAANLPPGAPLAAFAKIFLFWRGSLRMTNHYKYTTASTQLVGYETTPYAGLPNWTSDTPDRNALFDPTKSRSATVEFPWTSLSFLKHVRWTNNDFFPEDYDMEKVLVNVTAAEILSQYLSVGEDFVFGCPVAPPPLVLIAAELNNKKQKTKETLDLSVSSQNFVTLIKGGE
jgi:hypothetical protein